MRVLVWGSTPEAGWLAGRFHQVGYKAVWLTSEPIVTDIRRFRQLDLISPQRQLTITDLTIGSNIDELMVPPLDWIVLAMPMWAISDAIRDMARRIPPDNCPPILIVANGVGGQEKVQPFFPTSPVLQAYPTRHFEWTLLTSGRPAYESIVSTGSGGFGLSEGDKAPEARAMLLAADMGDVIIAPQPALSWSNLLWQIQANALPTLLQLSPEQIYEDERLFAFEHQQLREAVQIIDRKNILLIDLPGVQVRRLAWQIRILPPKLLAGTLKPNSKPPSLHPDLAQKTGRSSAAYLNGMVAHTANAMNLSTPVNYVLAVSITDVAERRALWHQFTPDYLSTLIRIAEQDTR